MYLHPTARRAESEAQIHAPFNRKQYVYTYQALASLGHNVFGIWGIFTLEHVGVWVKQ